MKRMAVVCVRVLLDHDSMIWFQCSPQGQSTPSFPSQPFAMHCSMILDRCRVSSPSPVPLSASPLLMPFQDPSPARSDVYPAHDVPRPSASVTGSSADL